MASQLEVGGVNPSGKQFALLLLLLLSLTTNYYSNQGHIDTLLLLNETSGTHAH